MLVFDRIEMALLSCERHLQVLKKAEIETADIERYLVAGLVVLIVSEYEEYLERIFRGRADKCGDGHVANFIKVSISQKFRSPDLSKINETLKRFDQSCLESFSAEIENSKTHAAWDSIMKARHAVVHKKGLLNLTFRELQEKYLDSKGVMQNVQVALGLDGI